MFTSDSSIPLNCLSQKLCMLTTNLSFIFLKPNTVSRHWKLYSTITWGISTNRSPSSSDVWCCQDHGWDQYFLPDLSRPVSDGVWCCYKTLRKVNLCEISQEMCKGQGEFYDGFRPKVTCTLAEATRVFHIAYKLVNGCKQMIKGQYGKWWRGYLKKNDILPIGGVTFPIWFMLTETLIFINILIFFFLWWSLQTVFWRRSATLAETTSYCSPRNRTKWSRELTKASEPRPIFSRRTFHRLLKVLLFSFSFRTAVKAVVERLTQSAFYTAARALFERDRPLFSLLCAIEVNSTLSLSFPRIVIEPVTSIGYFSMERCLWRWKLKKKKKEKFEND